MYHHQRRASNLFVAGGVAMGLQVYQVLGEWTNQTTI